MPPPVSIKVTAPDGDDFPIRLRRPFATRRRVPRLARAAALAVAGMTVACNAGSTGVPHSDSKPTRPGSAAPATSASTVPVPTTSEPTTTTTAPPPPDIAAPSAAATSGEGHWNPAGRSVAGRTALYTTLLRPPSGGAQVGVAWIDTSITKMLLYAGTSEPAGSWAAQGFIAPPEQRDLVAAFNSGFKFGAAGGGWYNDGRVGVSLRDGAASLVVRRDGSAIVGQWGRDATLTPEVTAVRQNLRLLVDGGVPVPAASSPGAWGATLGGVRYTWRSGLGDDCKGHLLFVGGPGLDPSNLAATLVAVGAVRAMELDINPQWVSFVGFDDFYGHSSAVRTKLLSSMNYSADHFLAPSGRDFVAVFSRSR